MAVDERFRAIISAVDLVTAPIRRIQASLAGLGRQPGMQRLGAMTARLTASLTSLGRVSASLSVPLAGLGAAGAVAAGVGMVAMVNQTIEAGDNLSALADQLGISVERIQELNYAALQSNVSQEAMTGALQRLGRGMHEAATGGNKDLLGLFRRMRIPLRDARGQLRSTADVLPDLAQAFRNTSNPALRTAAAMEIFGRGGGELLPLLMGGREGLEELAARFRQLGGSITSDTVPQLAAADAAMNDMRTAMAGMRDAIVVQLTPALAPLLTDFATFIGQNRAYIALHVEAGFKAMAEALRGIDWTATREGISGFIDLARAAYDAVGGWKNILIGFGVALAAPFVAAALSITTTLGGIALAMGAASPIGLAIIGIAAAAALIIRNWEPIRAFFSGLWDGVAAAWDGAWARMKPSLDMFAAIIGAIGDAIQRLITLIPNIPSIETRAPEVQERQRGNEAARGRASGFYAGPAVDPDGPDAVRTLPPPPPRVERPRRGGLRAPQAPLVDPDTGAPLSAQPQSLRAPADPSASAGVPAARDDRRASLWGGPGAGRREGEVGLTVRFENAPPGTRVETTTRGEVVRNPTVAVGYARLGVA
jgi:hypothetical protein